MRGGKADQEHIDNLMRLAESQVDFAIQDCLRHMQAHMNVGPNHDSNGVVRRELISRLRAKLDGLDDPAPAAQQSDRGTDFDSDGLAAGDFGVDPDAA
jgi:hypothetical protein